MEELLSRWWVNKYKLPSNHNLFESSTVFDLLIEFWEDQYYQNPIETSRNEKGEIQFVDTGDDLIDKWEKEFAEGKIPDYLEAFSQEQIDTLNRLRIKGRNKFGGGAVKPTLKATVENVTQEALKQGLNDPSKVPFPYKRFEDPEFR